jgi:hypothetical protein
MRHLTLIIFAVLFLMPMAALAEEAPPTPLPALEEVSDQDAAVIAELELLELLDLLESIDLEAETESTP